MLLSHIEDLAFAASLRSIGEASQTPDRDACSAADASPAPPRIVTTSWDDGDLCDMRIAERLAKHKLQGTFYVPISGHLKSRVMREADLRELVAQGFEIGAHSLSHQPLSQLGRAELTREVEDCKTALEGFLPQRISMFAYPRGRYSRSVVQSVRNAGYVGARSTQMLADGLAFDPFLMPTTLQVFPHTRLDYLKNLARRGSVGRMLGYVHHLAHCRTWLELGMRSFDRVMMRGGVWHLYGHSWEIEDFNLWDELDQILEYVSGREGFLYVTNSAVLSFREERGRVRVPREVTLP